MLRTDGSLPSLHILRHSSSSVSVYECCTCKSKYYLFFNLVYNVICEIVYQTYQNCCSCVVIEQVIKLHILTSY